VLRDLMFHEKASSNSKVRNHAHRALDWSWRLVPEGNDAQVQEVILVARVGGARGQLEQLQTKSDPRLPTHLWLGETPRPQMPGTLHQETVIRVLLPVAPMKAT